MKLYEKGRECLEIYIEFWVFLDLTWSEFYEMFCRDEEDDERSSR